MKQTQASASRTYRIGTKLLVIWFETAGISAIKNLNQGKRRLRTILCATILALGHLAYAEHGLGSTLAYEPFRGWTTTCVGLTCGSTFEVLRPLTVTGLAVYYGSFASQANTPDPVVVGLWNTSGDLLATATVNLNSQIYNQFWHGELIAPVSLSQNSQYILGAFIPTINSGAFSEGNSIWTNGFGDLSDNVSPINGLTTSGYGRNGDFTLYGQETSMRFPTEHVLGSISTANLILDSSPSNGIPEPASSFLVAGALLAVVARRFLVKNTGSHRILVAQG